MLEKNYVGYHFSEIFVVRDYLALPGTLVLAGEWLRFTKLVSETFLSFSKRKEENMEFFDMWAKLFSVAQQAKMSCALESSLEKCFPVIGAHFLQMDEKENEIETAPGA